MFGVDRAVPGLLLFRAGNARGLSDEEFLDQVWGTIEDANGRAEGFSQISRSMVVVVGEEVECPVTDKSSIKRAAVYREFSNVIDGVYARLESEQEGNLVFDMEEMEDWLVKMFEDMGVLLESKEMDFFSAGVDSLKAIQMRALVIRSLNLGGNAARVSSMVVYDSKNMVGLARTLVELRTGTASHKQKDEIKEMEELIDQFSVFEKRVSVDGKQAESCVVVSIKRSRIRMRKHANSYTATNRSHRLTRLPHPQPTYLLSTDFPHHLSDPHHLPRDPPPTSINQSLSTRISHSRFIFENHTHLNRSLNTKSRPPFTTHRPNHTYNPLCMGRQLRSPSLKFHPTTLHITKPNKPLPQESVQ